MWVERLRATVLSPAWLWRFGLGVGITWGPLALLWSWVGATGARLSKEGDSGYWLGLYLFIGFLLASLLILAGAVGAMVLCLRSPRTRPIAHGILIAVASPFFVATVVSVAQRLAAILR